MGNDLQRPRRQYSPEQKQQLIEQWKQSGLNRQKFCRQKDLCYSAFLRWQRGSRAGVENNAAGFVPITIPSAAETIFARIETGDKSLLLYQAVSPHFLRQLIR